jgi:RNA polymerase sigma factor (sigma-70 family)
MGPTYETSRMPTAQNAVLLNHLHRLVQAQSFDHVADQVLLQRFTRDRDEGAFETLLRRHGPMVLSVCRRILPHTADAEDAFQATFLVLTRKAAALAHHESAAGWLHEVAHRVALKVRRDTARRRFHETHAPERHFYDPLTEISGRELVGVLDEELARLAVDSRAPLVLCYLEGLTQDEAARRLGLSLSTLKRRLERGRERLRLRLTKRGLALSTALSACTLSTTVASALPPSLLKLTIQAAASTAAGKSAGAVVVSAQVCALTQGVIKAMFVSKLKTVTLALLTMSAIGVGSGAIALHRPAQAADGEQVAQAPQDQRSERPQQIKPPAATLRETREIVSGDTKDAKNDVLSLVFSADGKKLASVKAGGVAIIWDVATGKAVKTIGGALGEVKEISSVLSVQFTPDGQTIVAGHEDKTVWLWMADGKVVTDNGEYSFKERLEKLQQPFVTGLAISPDGKSLILADEEMLSMADVATGKVLWKALWIIKISKDIRGGRIAFSPDGKLLASEDNERRVAVFDASTGKVVHSLESEKGTGQGVAFSPDGKLIATGEDKAVNLWDVTTGKRVRSVQGRNGKVACVTFSPDGKMLVAGSADGVLRLHDVNGGSVVVTIHAHKAGISSVAFSPDGKTLATGAADGVLKLWNWEGEAIRTLSQDDKKEVNYVTFTDKGTVQAGDRFDALLGELIKAKKADDQIVEALFVATLTRLPTETEKGLALKHLEKQGYRRQEALSELLGSLTQTQEFRTHLEALNQRASGKPRQ